MIYDSSEKVINIGWHNGQYSVSVMVDMSVKSWLIIMLVDISYTHSSDRLTYQPTHSRHSVNMLDDTPADMCATKWQNTLAECWFICAQHVHVGDKSKECQLIVMTNTLPNCAQRSNFTCPEQFHGCLSLLHYAKRTLLGHGQVNKESYCN